MTEADGVKIQFELADEEKDKMYLKSCWYLTTIYLRFYMVLCSDSYVHRRTIK